MSHYRDLNKELVEQVQSMRKHMKIFSDEVVYLKGELMRKHETEVFLKKQCYNWAINSFAQLIQTVQPDSDFLPVLEEHINSLERISCSSNGGRQAWRARISGAHRRSSLLTREFQRSNSVINLRKSVCSTSPLRGSNNETNDEEEEQNSQTEPTDAEEEENAEAAGNDATQTQMAPTAYMENIIFEESDEEEEEIYNCEEDIEVESVYESVEEVSINISEKRATLSDITNTLKSINISSKKPNTPDKSVNKKVPTKRAKKAKNLKGKENSSDEYTTSKEDSDSGITKQRNKITQRAKRTEVNNISEEDTLQEPRRCSNSRRNSDTNKSFPLNQNHGQITNDELPLNSTTLVLNDTSLRNFKNAACSTPNSRQNSLEATTSSKYETVSAVQTSSNTSNRPSRQCKPNNLTENSLRNKLRNESETKPLRKNCRKAKSKPKSKK